MKINISKNIFLIDFFIFLGAGKTCLIKRYLYNEEEGIKDTIN
jgi:hypothetical protein